MRIKWIDNAKGIAMLCVILGHMGGLMIGPVNVNFVFAFHLAIFFLLSGYTLKMKELNTTYMNDKFKRLMVPYFITCVCVLLMDIFNNAVYWDDGSISSVTNSIGQNLIRAFFASGTITKFGNIELGTKIGAIWFLPAMFFALLIVQWVLNYTESHLKRWGIILTVGMIGYISSWFIWLPFSVQPGMVASIFILLGFYLRKYDVLSKLKGWYYILFIIIFVIGIKKEYVYTYFVTNNYPDLIISFIVSVAGSFLIIKLASFTEKSKYLNYVGKNSLIFLCVHLFALETMGRYFKDVIQWIGISENMNGWAMFVCHVLFATAVTGIVIMLKRRIPELKAGLKKNRDIKDARVEIMSGIFIIFILVGSCSIDPVFRKIIFSCNMAGLVFLCGYIYRDSDDSTKVSVCKTAKIYLIPYIGFCAVHLLLQVKEITPRTFISDIKMYLLGLSAVQKVFTDVPSVGLAYFLLLLFAVSLIYLFLNRMIKKEMNMIAAVIVLSVSGVLLGNRGYWLPWSLDCALYLLVFYVIGICFKKYGILEAVRNRYISYFFLSCVWAFMIYKASMEVANRQFMPYGLVILGALGGIVLIYMLSSYINSNMFDIIGNLLKLLGRNTLYILIVHTLLNGYMNPFIARYLDPDYIYHMIVSLVIQLLLGVIVGEIISFVKCRCLFLMNKTTDHSAVK